MSMPSINSVNRFIRITLCIASVILIVLAGNSELSFSGEEPQKLSSYIFALLLLLGIYFLQKQIYSYLLPKKLIKSTSIQQESHYHKSFFNGCIGGGYVLVLWHIADLFYKTINFPPFFYIGIVLIFCGVLSKIKGVIEIELGDKNS